MRVKHIILTNPSLTFTQFTKLKRAKLNSEGSPSSCKPTIGVHLHPFHITTSVISPFNQKLYLLKVNVYSIHKSLLWSQILHPRKKRQPANKLHEFIWKDSGRVWYLNWDSAEVWDLYWELSLQITSFDQLLIFLLLRGVILEGVRGRAHQGGKSWLFA